MQQNSVTFCLCGLQFSYDTCCGNFHSGIEVPATAEILMRTRYSAYVLGLEDYLLRTWHSSTRPASIDFSDSSKTKWLGLQIKRHILIDSGHAQVEFIARYKVGGQSAIRLHEISDFVFEDSRWFYVSGVFPA
jgi:SEC-C motif domain protein